MLTITTTYTTGTENSVKFEPRVFTFSGGESQVVLPDAFLDETEKIASVCINAWIKNADHIMQLLLLSDAIRRAIPHVTLHLNMPYVPYARQDRVCNAGEALSAKVFCELINAQNFATVRIVDPHSDVVSALLNRVCVIDPTEMLEEILELPPFENGVTLMAPDAGARKRVLQLAKKLNVEKVAFAEKIRDTRTGKISGTQIPEDLAELPILVVDDICDGGRTFIELAKELKKVSTQPRYLYVTHGIFSKGFEELESHYQQIFTPYNWNQVAPNAKLSVLKKEF